MTAARSQTVYVRPVSARRAGAESVRAERSCEIAVGFCESVDAEDGVFGWFGVGPLAGWLLGSGVDVGESVGVDDGEGSVVAVGVGDVLVGSVATGVVDGVPPRQRKGSLELKPGIPSTCRNTQSPVEVNVVTVVQGMP